MGGSYQRSVKGNLQMCWEPWTHLSSGNNTSDFQYFTHLVWKNGSAFEKYRIHFYLHSYFLFCHFPFVLLCCLSCGHKVKRLFSSSTVPLPATPALCLDWVLGSELGADDLLVCRRRQPVEAGEQQGSEQETGSHLSASRAWGFQIPHVHVSLQRGRCGLQCSNTLFIPQLRLQRRCSEQTRSFVCQEVAVGLWNSQNDCLHSAVQGFGVNNSFDLSTVMLLAFLLAECHWFCSTEVPSNVSEV